jgi:hypothetical protein
MMSHIICCHTASAKNKDILKIDILSFNKENKIVVQVYQCPLNYSIDIIVFPNTDIMLSNQTQRYYYLSIKYLQSQNISLLSN